MAAASEAVLSARLRDLKEQMGRERAEFRAREAALLRLARRPGSASAGLVGVGSVSSGTLESAEGGKRADGSENGAAWYGSTKVGSHLSDELRLEAERLYPDLEGAAARHVKRALAEGQVPEEREREIWAFGSAHQSAGAQLDALAGKLIAANISAERTAELARGRGVTFASGGAQNGTDTAGAAASRMRSEVEDARALEAAGANAALAGAAAAAASLGTDLASVRALRSGLREALAHVLVVENSLRTTKGELAAERARNKKLAAQIAEARADGVRREGKGEAAAAADDGPEAARRLREALSAAEARIAALRAELVETQRRYRTLLRKAHARGLDDGPDEFDETLGLGGGVFGRLQAHARMFRAHREAYTRAGASALEAQLEARLAEQGERLRRLHSAHGRPSAAAPEPPDAAAPVHAAAQPRRSPRAGREAGSEAASSSGEAAEEPSVEAERGGLSVSPSGGAAPTAGSAASASAPEASERSAGSARATRALCEQHGASLASSVARRGVQAPPTVSAAAAAPTLRPSVFLRPASASPLHAHSGPHARPPRPRSASGARLQRPAAVAAVTPPHLAAAAAARAAALAAGKPWPPDESDKSDNREWNGENYRDKEGSTRPGTAGSLGSTRPASASRPREPAAAQASAEEAQWQLSLERSWELAEALRHDVHTLALEVDLRSAEQMVHASIQLDRIKEAREGAARRRIAAARESGAGLELLSGREVTANAVCGALAHASCAIAADVPLAPPPSLLMPAADDEASSVEGQARAQCADGRSACVPRCAVDQTPSDRSAASPAWQTPQLRQAPAAGLTPPVSVSALPVGARPPSASAAARHERRQRAVSYDGRAWSGD